VNAEAPKSVRLAATLSLCVLVAGCGRSAERGTSTRLNAADERDWYIAVEAKRVEVTLREGSCWGSSAQTRTVLVRDQEVEVLPPASSGNQYRSLAWWHVTRGFFNRGFADADPGDARPPYCYGRPNYSCSFELIVDGRRVSGCCNHAYEIRAAFHRLVQPGRDDAIGEGR
jgi:hypothetical protein